MKPYDKILFQIGPDHSDELNTHNNHSEQLDDPAVQPLPDYKNNESIENLNIQLNSTNGPIDDMISPSPKKSAEMIDEQSLQTDNNKKNVKVVEEENKCDGPVRPKSAHSSISKTPLNSTQQYKQFERTPPNNARFIR